MKTRIPVFDPPDQWRCICGNSTSDAGFHLCDELGDLMEDTGDEWPSDLHKCGQCGRIMDLEGYVVGPGPVSILDLAAAALGREPITGEDFYKAGFQIMGGCSKCHASIAAYNAYPSKDGYWKCHDCIGEDGFMTNQEFEEDYHKDHGGAAGSFANCRLCRESKQ